MKAVIADPKTGRSYGKPLNDNDVKLLIGKRIGETIKGEILDLPGYEFKITGGNDVQGFAMRKSVSGTKRKKLLLSGGVGFKPDRKGLRRRKTVRGNTIDIDIAQINVKVIKQEKAKLSDLFKKEEAEKKEGEQ